MTTYSKILLLAIKIIAIQAIITPAIAKNKWQGVVTHVTDGDTLWIRPTQPQMTESLELSKSPKSHKPSNKDSQKVRIEGIDAPESCQLYGAASTAALKKFISLKTVTVTSNRFDDFGREIAKISFKDTKTNEEVDIGSWLVSNGHAWSYHYRHSAGPYRVEEEKATRLRLGLFANPSAIEPRVFRRENGSCQPSNQSSNQLKRVNSSSSILGSPSTQFRKRDN